MNLWGKGLSGERQSQRLHAMLFCLQNTFQLKDFGSAEQISGSWELGMGEGWEYGGEDHVGVVTEGRPEKPSH